jgi:hypothetical protein
VADIRSIEPEASDMSIDLDDAFGAYSREELEETLRSILRFAAIARFHRVGTLTSATTLNIPTRC